MWEHGHEHIDTWPHACRHRAMCTWRHVLCSEMLMESDSNQIWGWLWLWPIALNQICTLVHSAKPRTMHWTIARNRIPRSAIAGNKLRGWIYRQIWSRCRHSFSDQKCVVLYVIRHDQLIPPALPPPLLPHPPSSSQLWLYLHSLVYNLVRPETTTVPSYLNDVWSMLGIVWHDTVGWGRATKMHDETQIPSFLIWGKR